MMDRLQKLVAKIDAFQQAHPWAAFPYAVVKKYGDDGASNQGALITYYAFLALFPLLFAVTASLQLLLRNNPHLQVSVLAHIDSYFPLLGSQLQGNIRNVGKTGLALVAAIAVAVYGAHGAADAVRQTLDKMWGVPKSQRAGFPKNTIKSLVMIGVGGTTLLVAAFLSSYATSLGHGPIFKIVPTLMSFMLLIASLFVMLHIGLSIKIKVKALWFSAVLAAGGLQLLQTFGGYFMTHELHTLHGAYGAFSVTLALLFWIYLQVEVLLYAFEIGIVRAHKLWPRKLIGN